MQQCAVLDATIVIRATVLCSVASLLLTRGIGRRARRAAGGRAPHGRPGVVAEAARDSGSALRRLLRGSVGSGGRRAA